MVHEERPGTQPGADASPARGGLGTLRVPSAVDQVADRLLTAIALGEFSVGERLPAERELAAILGVSRPTVRAAVARLRDIGCLDVTRGRSGGHYVRSGWREESAPAVRRTLEPRWEQTKALLDARGLVESLIARTAAERRDARDIERMTGALAEYTAAATAPAAGPGAGPAAGARIRQSDAALHHAITRAAKNEPLALYSRQLLRDISAGFPIEPYRGNATERALADHRALTDAVVAGDGDTAAGVAARHFDLTEQALRAALERSLRPADRAAPEA
ncbi:FadR/GntR family transcriptional regulator [Streptomyces sp. NRRL F-5126]|uniref:FadR/GntR family transcriptional regulator n=1 Tax=Streptomyces sp. NRRL F-5126 TaxID=1463857 RepID=UPI00068FFA02|nr:FCD domain-containing protein [Streptomyces sp. NRRL F-5126]